MRWLLLSFFVVFGLALPPAGAWAAVDRNQLEREFAQTVKHARKVSAMDSLALLSGAFEFLPIEKQIKVLQDLTKRSAHPWVRTQGLVRLFPYLSSNDKARDLAEKHGFIHRWSVSQPQPCGPGRIEAKHREFIARMGTPGADELDPLEHFGGAGFTSLDHLLPSYRQQAIHAVLTLQAARDERGRLFLGSSGDVAVSVNGLYHGAMSGLRTSRPDQTILPVRLKAGANVIVLTMIPSPSEELRVYARIAHTSGKPLTGLTYRPWAPEDGWPVSGEGSERLTPIVDELKIPTTASSTLKRAVLKRSLGLPDVSGSEDRSLEDLMLTEAIGQLPKHQLLLALEFVPALESKKSILLHYWAQGRRESELALALASLCAIQENPVAARKWLDRAGSRLRGEHHNIVTARVWRYGNEAERAWLYVNEDVSAPKPSEALLRERALSARRLERFDLSHVVWSKLALAKPGSIEIVGAHIEDLQALGRGEDALDKITDLRNRHPHVVSLAFEAIRLALALGDRERAKTFVRSLRVNMGADLTVMRNLAMSYEELGEHKDAVDLYRTLVGKAPNDDVARQGLRRLAKDNQEQLPFPPFDSKAARSVPARTNNAYEILDDATHILLHKDGAYSKHRRRLIRAQRVPTSRDARTLSQRFDPSQVRISVLRARVHRGDVAIDSVRQSERQISKAWYGLYYDQRELSFVLDDLQVGDVIEITTRTDSVGSHPIPNAFELLRLLQGKSYTHKLSIEVDLPSSLKLHTRLNQGGGSDELLGHFSHREESSNERKRIIVEGKNIPSLKTERRMPGLAELVPYWQATTFESYSQLAREYSKLVDSQRNLTNAMREWIEQKKSLHLTSAGAVNRTQFLRSVVEGIAQEVRYVGLEFGIHGFQPYRTDQVWVRRFGDCKDQATLLTTLLNSVGIPAKVALMRTRAWGRINAPLPALGLFNHAVVWLPESQQFVDTTERTMGLGTLPASDIGAQVLILDDSVNGTLKQTPVPNALSNGVEADYSIVVRRDGSAALSAQITFRGVAASKQRKTLGNKSKQVHRVARMVNNRYAGSTLKSHKVSDLSDLQRPIELSLSAIIPTIGEKTKLGLRLRQPLGGSNLTSFYVNKDSRKHAVVLGSPSRFRFRYHYILPEDWTEHRVPPDHVEKSPFGSYRVRWQREAGAIRGELLFRLDKDQVSPEQYPEFHRFMKRLQEATKPDLEIRRLTGGLP